MSIKPGALRFNTDSMKLEIFRGSPNYEGSASMAGIGTLAAGQWEEIVATSPEAQTGGTRGLIAGGIFYPATYYNTIQYINIATTGNSQDFGDLTSSRTWQLGGAASSTRAIFAGGDEPGNFGVNDINYVTISSTGNAQDFGDLLAELDNGAANSTLSNSTRGLFAGGSPDGGGTFYGNVIQYITIASTGDAKDFGDAINSPQTYGTCASSTRGIIAGGYVTNNVIQHITISTQGNAGDFGDLTEARYALGGASNATRGIFSGGVSTGNNRIDYITISTLGNAIDFGDMSTGRFYAAVMASSTRVTFAGGAGGSPSVDYNIIDYVTIAQTGNAVDFGDLNVEPRRGSVGASNGHGGL